VQSEPNDEIDENDHVHHHGTIAADGTGLFVNVWGQVAGFGGDIMGFGGGYPSPASGLTLDAIASPPPSRTAGSEVNSDGATSGSSGTSPATQGLTGTAASGIDIIASLDSSITDLTGTLYSGVTAAINAAIGFYEREITTPITITIDFGYGEVGGETMAADDLGESLANYSPVPYGTLTAALTSHAESIGLDSIAANLPSTISAAGATWYVADAELAALGLSTYIFAPDLGTAGYVGLSSTLPLTYPPNGRAVSSEYDAIGALEHEISEDMGRVTNYGLDNYSALSLFRYTSDDTLANTGNESAYFSIDGGNTNLAEFNAGSNGGDPGDWASSVVDDSYDAFASIGVANTVSATDLTVMEALGYTLADTSVCFVAGTRVATPTGEAPVERLAIGDLVLTAQGNARPIVWIGTGRVLATRGRRSAATPVIVRGGALADNVPTRDLRVTKGHSLLLDGVLIPVEELVNHRSILWDDRAREVSVYHIELETHDVLLANGAPAESYRDDGNRWLFQNGNTGWGLRPKPPCAAVLTGGPIVDTVWRRLLDRAGPRPGLPLTRNPDLHLLVGGARRDGAEQRPGVYVFNLAGVRDDVRVVSRAAIPQELGLARDPRSLGVALRRITVSAGCESRVIEAEDKVLEDGFYAFEVDNGFRWTAGDAVLPAALFIGFTGPVELSLHVGCTTHYVVDGAARLVA
jgi:hypothetical protein